jgi:hypothetical protein
MVRLSGLAFAISGGAMHFVITITLTSRCRALQ